MPFLFPNPNSGNALDCWGGCFRLVTGKRYFDALAASQQHKREGVLIGKIKQESGHK